MSRKKCKYMDDDKTVMIQSKISIDTSRRLDEIVKKFGFSSRYEILQYLVSAFLHYADPTTPADDTLEVISGIYAGSENPDQRFNTVRSEDGDMEVTDVVSVMHRPGSSAYTCRWTHRDDKGEMESGSAAVVLDMILARLLPTRYDYLRRVADELQSNSVLYALDYLIEADKRAGIPDVEDFKSNAYGIVPVRHNNQSMDR